MRPRLRAGTYVSAYQRSIGRARGLPLTGSSAGDAAGDAAGGEEGESEGGNEGGEGAGEGAGEGEGQGQGMAATTTVTLAQAWELAAALGMTPPSAAVPSSGAAHFQLTSPTLAHVQQL